MAISTLYFTLRSTRLLIYITSFKDTHIKIRFTEHVIRSQYSRTDNQQTVPMIGSTHRDQGDITIDNHLNGRYEGEIQVIKAPMPGHSHINCGHVCDKDVPLLSLIQPGDTFKFVYTKENNK